VRVVSNAISLQLDREMYVLNLTPRLAGSELSRGSILDSIFMPSERALGGINERKRRAGFERGENGLKVTRTSVRNLVIIAAAEEYWRGSSAQY
jgi:hypothetical protein